MTGMEAAWCSNACYLLSVLSCDDIWDDVIAHVHGRVVCFHASLKRFTVEEVKL
jgi:hypothetical protein